MWNCKKCRERVEDSFEVCWSCGTSKEGVEDPSFQKADEREATENAPPSEEPNEDLPAQLVDLDSYLSKRFLCPKCKNRGASVKRFATTGTGISRLLDIQHNEFVAVSCTQCSFTELYNPQILEGKGLAISILDVLFGR